MVERFTLCADCLAKYKSLRFDPDATYTLNIMPLCSLMWSDEHPDGDSIPDRLDHQQCRNSIIRAAIARMSLWRSGELSNEAKELWNEAKTLLPDWPLFQRLSLDAKQMQSLDGCAGELQDLMGAIRKDFPVITTTNEGGGVHQFTARRATEGNRPMLQQSSVRRWWQFWK